MNEIVWFFFCLFRFFNWDSWYLCIVCMWVACVVACVMFVSAPTRSYMMFNNSSKDLFVGTQILKVFIESNDIESVLLIVKGYSSHDLLPLWLSAQTMTTRFIMGVLAISKASFRFAVDKENWRFNYQKIWKDETPVPVGKKAASLN